MVGIVTGSGFGLERSSGSVLGGSGLVGGGLQGTGGEGVFVNAATGNLVLQKQDEFLAGLGLDLGVSRTYNSLTTLADDNNDKWRQGTDRRVYGLTGTLGTAGSTVKRVSGDGSEITYTWDAGRSAYVATDGAGAYDTITNTGSQWVWTDGDSGTVERYAYDSTGQIASVTDRNGNQLSFSYDGSGRLSQVTDANGEWIRYEWSGSTNNIADILTGYTDLATSTSKTLTRTRYGYDGSNRLTSVTQDLTPGDNSVSDGASYVTTYGYDGSGRVNSITQSDGSSLAITYDGSGRVATLVQTVSTGVTRTTTLGYNTGYTTVTDAAGQVTRLDYDASGQLTTITAPPAWSGAAQQVVQFAYNANGDVTSVTDALGNATSYSNFTGNGLAQTVTDRLGNAVTRTFSAANLLLSETRSGVDATGAAVSETTRYVYNSAGNLRFVISPQGRVTEYTVASTGLVSEATEYTQASYTTAGTPSEATMASWVSGLTDRSWVQKTAYTYDARGNLTSTTRYGIANSAGAGQTSDGTGVITYSYDQAGQLLSSYAGSNTATSYIYDGMGRVISTSDANGGTTTIAFNDASGTTTVTLASGYVTTKTYNKAGDLVSVTDSGSNTTGGSTSYTYDALGRVRMTTDATGLKTYTIYDGAGRHVGDVDNDGNLTEYVYDADNRLIGTLNYHTRLSAGTLTNLANPAYSVVMSSLRPTASSQDTKSWVVYDKEGRVLQTIAGDGSTTISTYDASGRLQQTTGYANKLAQTTVDGFITTPPTTVSAPTTSSNDAVVRNFYDQDGLLIGSLDGEGYLTANTYDQAGRLVTATRYATATSSSLRASGSFNALQTSAGTSAQDRTTRFAYDGRGLLRYSIDALGEVVRYDYDTAGQKTTTTVYAATISTSDYSYAGVKAATASLEANSANRRSFAVYDTAGRLAYGIDAAGTVTGYSYDNRGQVTRSVVYATSYATTSLPALATMATWSSSNIANSANRITRTWYTARGEAAYVVDAEGYASRRDYDARGQVKVVTAWVSKVTVSDSTTFAQVTAAVSGATHTRKWDYDSLGRVVTAYDGNNVTTTYTYHGATSLVNTVTRAANGSSAEQATTSTLYDAAGRAIQVTDALGTSDTVSYNGRGLTSSGTEAAGLSVAQTTSYTYDLDGRVKTVTNALGGVTAYEYNAFGEVWKTTDPNGNITYSWYDKLGRVTTTRDAANYLTTTSYTTFGEIASVKRWQTAISGTASMTSEPAGTGTVATTSFTYDRQGRVLTSTDALGNVEAYVYDALGNRIQTTNKLGGVTKYSYDRLGNLTRQQVAASTTNWQEGSNYSGGNLTSASSVAGSYNVTTYNYDAFGNMWLQFDGYTNSDGGMITWLRFTQYSFDLNNRLTGVTNDAVTTIADDMVTVTGNVSVTQANTLDARGNVIKSIDAGGAATYAYYDKLDRKVAEIRQVASSQWVYTAYSYDANGNLVSTRVYEGNGYSGTPPLGGTVPSVPSGAYRQTDFGYDGLNRLVTTTVVSTSGNTITSGSWNGSSYTTSTGNLVTTNQYDADGNVVKVIDANGNVTWSWYDSLSRKTAQVDGEGYLTTWTYNAEGNVLTETRYATRYTGTPSLSAPPSVSATSDDRTTSFTYDLVGNRKQESRSGVIAWNVDATTGALSAAGTSSVIDYTYNALGQVVTKTVAGAQIGSYSYDNTGRLTSESRASFTDANGATVTPTTSYAYDALGDLVTTTQQAGSSGTYATQARVTTNRYGEGGRLLSTTDAEGNVHTYYYDAMGRLKKDAYSRIVEADTSTTSNTTTTVTEAQGTTYDLAGRVLTRSIYSTVSGTFQRIGFTSYQYNAYDQVVAEGQGSDSASGMNAGSARFQTSNQYDGAGRLVATNSGDGIWKFFSYDANGNQTAALTSAGYAFTSSTGFAGAFAQVGQATVNGTFTVYDKRGMATQVIEEGRDLSSSVTGQTLNTSRTYNAFGEVASETNAATSTVSYTYNTMGRMIRSESPAVQITLENGLEIWVKPSEDYYYDLGGRLIGSRDASGTYGTSANTQATAYSKAANTGNLTTMSLLAGTGYDKSQSLIATEFHADGGRKQNLYDIMGDQRVIRDELYSTGTPNLHAEERSYNRLGQLTQVKHNRATNVADDSTRLVDNYAYDQFGQRIAHSNNQATTPAYGTPVWVTEGHYETVYYGWYSGYYQYWVDTSHYETPIVGYNSVYEKTSYDALGRVTSQADFAGLVTNTAYAWDGTLTTSIGGSNLALGGWVQTTTYSGNTSLYSVVKSDIYNREVYKRDLGNHVFTDSYDAGGRQISKVTGATSQTWVWYNTGWLKQASGPNGDESYDYDAVGHRTTELLIQGGVTIKSAQSQYDALGRITYWNQDAATFVTSPTFANGPVWHTTPRAYIDFRYDAVGNVRRTTSTHYSLNQDGAVSSGTTSEDYWFRYDSMNRLVTDKGHLTGAAGAAGTTIVRNQSGGTDYVYDAAGGRAAAMRTQYAPPEKIYYAYPDIYGWQYGYFYESRDNYTYDGAGRLSNISTTYGSGVSETDYNSQVPGGPVPAAPSSGGYQRSTFTYDLSGRQLTQSDYDPDGTSAVYSRSAVWSVNGRLTSDSTATVKYDGATYVTNSTYSYANSGGDLNGAVYQVVATNLKNNQVQSTTTTTNTYQWWDGAMQDSIAYQNGGSTFTTSLSYNAFGQLLSANIVDGRRRYVTYRLDASGQIIRRDEEDYSAFNVPINGNDPHEVWYRFAGKEMGYIGNNGSSQFTEDGSIADRRQMGGTGPFRNGYSSPTADFATSSVALNSYYQGSSGGSYTVQRSGETLRSIAAQLWGDSSLWYKIADANGMSGDTSLTEGQRISLPSGVTRSGHSAANFKPYDANAAIGNVSPTTPAPPAQNKRGCGIIGIILLAVVAIAVTVVTAGTALSATGAVSGGVFGAGGGIATVLGGGMIGAAGLGGAVVIGAASAAVGSIVSQGFGIMTGIQDKFSWGAVGLAALGGAIGGATSGVKVFGTNGLGSMTHFANDVARGAITSAATQGIGVATGLQDKFSWAGVAAAGVGAGVSGALMRGLNKSSWDSTAGMWKEGVHLSWQTQGAASAASMFANAATRSVLDGTDFGDNILAALPDVIANTIGNLVAEQVAGGGREPENLLKGTPYDGPVDSSNTANLTYESGVPRDGIEAPPPDDPAADIVVTAWRPDRSAIPSFNFSFLEAGQAAESASPMGVISRGNEANGKGQFEEWAKSAAGPDYYTDIAPIGVTSLRERLGKFIFSDGKELSGLSSLEDYILDDSLSGIKTIGGLRPIEHTLYLYESLSNPLAHRAFVVQGSLITRMMGPTADLFTGDTLPLFGDLPKIDGYKLILAEHTHPTAVFGGGAHEGPSNADVYTAYKNPGVHFVIRQVMTNSPSVGIPLSTKYFYFGPGVPGVSGK